MDPAFDAATPRSPRCAAGAPSIKRALLDQTLVSGIGNIYADEALWRARLHCARPTETLTRAQGRRGARRRPREVMDEALAAGGTSFDALYVNVERRSRATSTASLDVYGREADRRARAAARRSAASRS